jgi:hypothetical protein
MVIGLILSFFIYFLFRMSLLFPLGRYTNRGKSWRTGDFENVGDIDEAHHFAAQMKATRRRIHFLWETMAYRMPIRKTTSHQYFTNSFINSLMVILGVDAWWDTKVGVSLLMWTSRCRWLVKVSVKLSTQILGLVELVEAGQVHAALVKGTTISPHEEDCIKKFKFLAHFKQI